jgi:hypothetical protein
LSDDLVYIVFPRLRLRHGHSHADYEMYRNIYQKPVLWICSGSKRDILEHLLKELMEEGDILTAMAGIIKKDRQVPICENKLVPFHK